MGARLKAAVAGANGYAGMTVVNLLARHPEVELAQLTSRSFAGKPYASVFPLLDLEGEFLSEPEPAGLDVVFSCLPHNVGAAKAGAWLSAGAKVVDMSADFRLKDPGQYPTWYRQEHPAKALLAKAVFGLPELHERELAGAELVAVPAATRQRPSWRWHRPWRRGLLARTSSSTPSRASAARAGRRRWGSISARSTNRWGRTPSRAIDICPKSRRSCRHWVAIGCA